MGELNSRMNDCLKGMEAVTTTRLTMMIKERDVERRRERGDEIRKGTTGRKSQRERK